MCTEAPDDSPSTSGSLGVSHRLQGGHPIHLGINFSRPNPPYHHSPFHSSYQKEYIVLIPPSSVNWIFASPAKRPHHFFGYSK